jgi:mTERF domain-containing protein
MGDNSQASDADSSEEETDVQFPETEIIVSSSPKTRFNFSSLGSGDSEDLN